MKRRVLFPLVVGLSAMGALGACDLGVRGRGPSIGPSCKSTDPNHLCIGVKYVTYQDSSGQAYVSQDTAVSNIVAINKIWSQCNVGFQIEEYLSVDPTYFGLAADSSAQYQLDTIRAKFNTDDTFLVVTTANWGTTKNAWTQPPGAGVYGVVMEAKVGDYPPIIAHELGHYLNLDHVSDTLDLMNPIIYTNSTDLYDWQCSNARDAANNYWDNMLRSDS